jgi:hypothetical protein
MIFFLLLLGLVLVAQIAELFIPALPWLYNAHVYIVPVIVFYGAWHCLFPSCWPWRSSPGFYWMRLPFR